MSPGVPFESNPPPDAMPDLDLEVDRLPFTEVTAGSFRSGEVEKQGGME